MLMFTLKNPDLWTWPFQLVERWRGLSLALGESTLQQERHRATGVSWDWLQLKAMSAEHVPPKKNGLKDQNLMKPTAQLIETSSDETADCSSEAPSCNTKQIAAQHDDPPTKKYSQHGSTWYIIVQWLDSSDNVRTNCSNVWMCMVFPTKMEP